jgi:hemerythrin-like domain-containing protein
MKRHEALVHLSRDHHFGLLLVWKLKQGLAKEVSVERMAKYISVFYQHHLKPHFFEEEETIFKILGEEHLLIKEAISQHRTFEKMILAGFKNTNQIKKFRELLELHIRKEEREIFPEIENAATDEQLEALMKLNHPELKEPEYNDIFWK